MCVKWHCFGVGEKDIVQFDGLIEDDSKGGGKKPEYVFGPVSASGNILLFEDHKQLKWKTIKNGKTSASEWNRLVNDAVEEDKTGKKEITLIMTSKSLGKSAKNKKINLTFRKKQGLSL